MGTVCVTPGTYTEDIDLRPHVSLVGAGASTRVLGHLGTSKLPDADSSPTTVSNLTLSAGYLAVVSSCANTSCNPPLSLSANYSLMLDSVSIEANDNGGSVYCGDLEFVSGNVNITLRDVSCKSNDRGFRIRYNTGSSAGSFQVLVERSRFEPKDSSAMQYDPVEVLAVGPWQANAPTGTRVNVVVRNNEFIRTNYEGVYLTRELMLAPTDAAASGMLVTNNSFVCGSGSHAIWDNSITASPALTVANNLFYGCTTPELLARTPSTTTTSHNLVASVSPFVNVAVGDLHLVAGSAPINAADVRYAPADDKDGKPRPLSGTNGDLPDVGAHEF
jgi:hypothetical protein